MRDNFVRPFIAGSPGNVHSIRNLALAPNLVAVEWSFEAVHSGVFGNIPATAKRVQVRGWPFYEYDLLKRTIPAGRIYLDVGTLMRQIGAGAQVGRGAGGRASDETAKRHYSASTLTDA